MREFYVFFCLIITAITRVKCESVTGDRPSTINCPNVMKLGNEENATLTLLTVADLQLDNNFENLKNVSFHNITFTNVDISSSKISVPSAVRFNRLKWPGINASALRVKTNSSKPFLCQLPFRHLLFDGYRLSLRPNSCMTYDRMEYAGEASTKPVGKLSLRRRLSLQSQSSPPPPPRPSINVTLDQPLSPTLAQLPLYSYRISQYSRPIPPSPAPSFCPTADALYEPICPHNASTSGASVGTVYTPVLGGFSYHHIVLHRARGRNQYPVRNNIWSCPTWHRSVCITAPKFNCTVTWIFRNGHTSPMFPNNSVESTIQNVSILSTTQSATPGSTTQSVTSVGSTTQSVISLGLATTQGVIHFGQTTHRGYPGLLTTGFYAGWGFQGDYPGWTPKNWYPGWTYGGVHPTDWYPGWTTWGKPVISFWLPKSREIEDLKRIYGI